MKRVILDLCAGTGAWSQPYVEAGYDVRRVTLPESDVTLYEPPPDVWGILAAPPCTEFAVTGARWWSGKPPGLLRQALRVVIGCLRIIALADPHWWALENPVGRLSAYLGPPTMWFHPADYGDAWTKKTLLWGRFAKPVPLALSALPERQCKHGTYWLHCATGGRRAMGPRSVTPPGFARAFFEANP